ncbi:MAG TPA: hypothetical protein VHN16_13610 [Streptosporangiaceae bacterium]|nr:hypothetical protein [Streptosporangiaceae bacterium]
MPLAPVAACAVPGGQAHDDRRRLKSELAEHAWDVFLVPYLGELAVARGRSPARSQIEHGEVTSFEVIARYVEALGGRLDLVADFGDRTVRLPGRAQVGRGTLHSAGRALSWV